VIALPPVVQDGFDTVLTEAKNAGIPVIIVDRSVSSDKSLYASHIGSDMVLEGNRAAAEMNKLLPNGGAVLELSGTTGSGAAVGRTQGFKDKLNANIKILDSQTGDFTRAEAIPVMQAFLQKYKAGTDFQGIEIQNDDMGLGAIEAATKLAQTCAVVVCPDTKPLNNPSKNNKRTLLKESDRASTSRNINSRFDGVEDG
jgi:ABC-type sugar transport system substrate-binding protein